MYRENANKPTTGKGRGGEMLRERSEKQREKVKDGKAKNERKKKRLKKSRPGVEREMKMNERCSSGM